MSLFLGGYRLRNKSVVDTSKKTNAYWVFNFSKHFVPMREYSSDCGQFVCLGENWLIYLFYTLVCALVLTFFGLIWGGVKFWNLYHETRPSLMKKRSYILLLA